MPVAEALLDFYPVAETREEGREMISGLLVAAVKEAVLANVDAVQAAGLEPVEVDLIPFALTRALIAGNSAQGTVALVHVGAVTTTVVVAIDGVPQFVRIIQNGSEDITNALSTRLGIDSRQADQVKRGFGLTTEGISADWRPAVEVIYQATGDLMGGIRNTLSFYVSTRPGAVIDKIFVSGGGAEMTGFSSALAETMRIQVFTPNALDRFAIARTVSPESVDAGSAGLPVAVGLALGSVA